MTDLVLLLCVLCLGLLGFPLMGRVDAFLEKIRSPGPEGPLRRGDDPLASPHHHDAA